MKHVIHYHLPSKEDEFTHRNGRTARMLASGTAYIIAHESEKKMDYIDYGIEKLNIENSQFFTKTTGISDNLYKWRKEKQIEQN